MTTPPARPPATAFEVAERVRWEDVDLVGITRYSAYTRLLDVGETELLRSVGLQHPRTADEYHVWLVRRVLHLEYVAPSRFDALLRIRVWVGRVGRTSLTLHYQIVDDATAARHVEGHVVLVAVDATTMQAREVPAGIVAALTTG